MCEQTMNGQFAPGNGVRAGVRRTPLLDRIDTLLYNMLINIRAFADRFGLLAMALFLTADIFDEDLSA